MSNVEAIWLYGKIDGTNDDDWGFMANGNDVADIDLDRDDDDQNDDDDAKADNDDGDGDDNDDDGKDDDGHGDGRHYQAVEAGGS